MPMPLNQLLPQAQSGTLIRELTLDSRKVRPGDLFLAVPGTSQDGRAHIADALAPGEPFCIVIPPPNITGSLHMGHALNTTLQDILVRWKRMDGYNTLWLPGTDHAGIATQWVVEQQLAREGTDRHAYGREHFIERVWRWREESGRTIVRQLMRLGASCDWSRERFTLDEDLSLAVREVFVRLYDEGLIYRGQRLVNWDPVLHTAISDLEVVSEEEEGQLWHLRYPLADGSGYVVVATTRPETMLGDSAVVTLSAAANGTIRFTLDGSVPTGASAAYTAPIRLGLVPAGTTVSARLERPDGRLGAVRRAVWRKGVFLDADRPNADGLQPGLTYMFGPGRADSVAGVARLTVTRTASVPDAGGVKVDPRSSL